MTKILISEDERDIRDLIAFTLKFAGYDVVVTKDGQEAVEQIPIEMPDLIILDVRMPRMTGYEACREIKQNDKTKHIPVLFLSAKGQDAEIQEGMDAGAEEYLVKPFAPNDLLSKVKVVIDAS